MSEPSTPHSRALRTSIVVISDRREQAAQGIAADSQPIPTLALGGTAAPIITGGYLERLPLAAVHGGLADFAEVWHHREGDAQLFQRDSDFLVRRTFEAGSDAMLEFIGRYGAPRILCVWGLGVGEDVLRACADSFIIYNSIDVPALRVQANVSRHFDLVLTGAQWQSDAVHERHPDMPTAILPIGPEFASPETFFPTGEPKLYDVAYVAAAQPYKRHDLLFDALERSPRALKAICVMGYGEDADALRAEAVRRRLDVDFVGPPGVPYDEVNRLMNWSRVGVVCGEDDGAPAILTEYMLAGLPVVANAALKCGLQYLRFDTGIIVPADRLEFAIAEALDNPERFSPRQTVIENWAWPHSIAQLALLIGDGPKRLHSPFHTSSGHPEGGRLEPSNAV